jgi:hypothetical protein
MFSVRYNYRSGPFIFSGRYNYQAAHDISKPLDTLPAAKRNAVLAAVCRKIEAVANPVGPSQENLPDAAGPQYMTQRAFSE